MSPRFGQVLRGKSDGLVWRARGSGRDQSGARALSGSCGAEKLQILCRAWACSLFLQSPENWDASAERESLAGTILTSETIPTPACSTCAFSQGKISLIMIVLGRILLRETGVGPGKFRAA